MNQTPTPVDLVILTPLKIEYQSIIPYLSNIKLEKVGGHLYELGNYKGEYLLPHQIRKKSFVLQDRLLHGETLLGGLIAILNQSFSDSWIVEDELDTLG